MPFGFGTGDAGVPAPAAASVRVLSFVTPTFDFLAAPAPYAFNTPAISGYRLSSGVLFCHIETRDVNQVGTLTVALAQSGVSIQGVTNSNITAANGNARPAPCRVSSTLINVDDIDVSVNPLQLLVIAAATGPAVFNGFFEVWATFYEV